METFCQTLYEFRVLIRGCTPYAVVDMYDCKIKGDRIPQGTQNSQETYGISASRYTAKDRLPVFYQGMVFDRG